MDLTIIKKCKSCQLGQGQNYNIAYFLIIIIFNSFYLSSFYLFMWHTFSFEIIVQTYETTLSQTYNE